jgi:putative ABC transport system substrate-binding protein
MRRRDWLRALGLAAGAATGLKAVAQPQRPRRIGYLSLLSLIDPPSPERQAFIDGLAELGHVQGRNLEIVYASAEGLVDFLDGVTRDLAAKNVELIVASGSVPLQTLQRVAPRVPVVMLAIGDPVGLKLVDSLARPGGNMTGVSFNSSELAAKRVQLLHELAPSARRLAILLHGRNNNARLESMAAEAAAAKLDLAPHVIRFTDDNGLTRGLQRAAAQRAELLYATFEGDIVARRRTEIAEFARTMKWPSVVGFGALAEAGFLLSYAPDFPALFRRGAYFVDRVLAGVKPAQLPVEQPQRFELVVNLSTARALEMTVPPSFLLRADRVIE